MPEEITHEMFADHLEKTFRIHCGDEFLDVELTEVEVREGQAIEGLRQPFTLIFRGPKDRTLGEGLYKVENEDVGTVELYIIPIITVGDRQNYQVVFN